MVAWGWGEVSAAMYLMEPKFDDSYKDSFQVGFRHFRWPRKVELHNLHKMYYSWSEFDGVWVDLGWAWYTFRISTQTTARTRALRIVHFVRIVNLHFSFSPKVSGSTLKWIPERNIEYGLQDSWCYHVCFIQQRALFKHKTEWKKAGPMEFLLQAFLQMLLRAFLRHEHQLPCRRKGCSGKIWEWASRAVRVAWLMLQFCELKWTRRWLKSDPYVLELLVCSWNSCHL